MQRKPGVKKAAGKAGPVPRPVPSRTPTNLPSRRPTSIPPPEESKALRSTSPQPVLPEPSPVLKELQERYTALLRVFDQVENSGGTQRNAETGDTDKENEGGKSEVEESGEGICRGGGLGTANSSAELG